MKALDTRIGTRLARTGRPLALITTLVLVLLALPATTSHALVLYTCGGQYATIVGSQEGDWLTGTSGNDVIVGLGGNDTIVGSRGNDIICGNDGHDIIYGGLGNDTIYGG